MSTEEELARLLQFFYQCPVGLLEIDDALTVTRINPAAARILAPALQAGEDLHALRSVLDRLSPQLLRAVMVDRDRMGPLHATDRILIPARSGGPPGWAELTATRVHVNQVMLILTDVTRERLARRDAEQANTAKSMFLSRMSHELRTPLNAVLGFAQLLTLDPLPDSQREAVEQILSGGRHLLAMIDDLLDISRIETDQLEISIEPVPVRDVITESVRLMRPLAAGAHIGLDLLDEADRLHVRADHRRLRQVLLNLLSNAVKYNRAGGRVEVSYRLTDSDEVAIAVTDTGIGIAAQDLHRLFTPFDRLDQQFGDIEGTGIGLALSQRLMTLQGGRLEVESTLGSGSTFTAILPVGAAPACTAEPEPDTDLPDLGERDGALLLYIEDNLPNAQLVEQILRHRPGWTLLHARHGTLGVELARTRHPQLILLDLHLPGADGRDILHILKTTPDTADVPVVILSADASPSQIRQLRVTGAHDYLTKPLNIIQFLHMLDTFRD